MHNSACILLVALCAQSVPGSHYHGPTARPAVLESGHLADTHEVAAAKGAHLAALAGESSYGHGGDYGGAYGGSYGYGGAYGHSYGHDVKYHGPAAIPHVLKNGHIADTHEVAVAKAEHYSAVAQAKSHHGGYGHGGYGQGHAPVYDSYVHGRDFRYHGPIAVPRVLKNGHIADTHDVAVAKAEHFQAVAEAKSHHGGYGHSHGYSSH